MALKLGARTGRALSREDYIAAVANALAEAPYAAHAAILRSDTFHIVALRSHGATWPLIAEMTNDAFEANGRPAVSADTVRGMMRRDLATAARKKPLRFDSGAEPGEQQKVASKAPPPNVELSAAQPVAPHHARTAGSGILAESRKAVDLTRSLKDLRKNR